MGLSAEQVQQWLSAIESDATIESDSPTHEGRLRKRQRCTSPAIDQDFSAPFPLTGQIVADPATPKAMLGSKRVASAALSDSGDELLVTASESQTHTSESREAGSRTSLPPTSRVALSLADDGIELEELGMYARPCRSFPPGSLLARLDAIEKGIHVIPAQLRPAVEQEEVFDVVPRNFDTRGQTETEDGMTVADVIGIWEDALHCSKTGAHESTWNIVVHGPLLRLAVHRGWRMRRQLVDVIPWYVATWPWLPQSVLTPLLHLAPRPVL